MLPHEDIPAHLTQADLFVLPSLSEGLPLVLVEAMSAGKPVVATEVGGIPDVLVDEGDGKTGYLVPPESPEALAEAITAVLSAPDKAHNMGQNGRDRIEKQFTWSTIADQTITIYRTLLSSKPRKQ
jgi:glycosyltransferase involved in cell wall biosynthesis